MMVLQQHPIKPQHQWPCTPQLDGAHMQQLLNDMKPPWFHVV
jgi:hypothetical protein